LSSTPADRSSGFLLHAIKAIHRGDQGRGLWWHHETQKAKVNVLLRHPGAHTPTPAASSPASSAGGYVHKVATLPAKAGHTIPAREVAVTHPASKPCEILRMPCNETRCLM